MKQIRFTKEGYEKLKLEHERLIAERKLTVIDVTKAREMGDLSENGYYKASKAKLGDIDRQLRRISSELKQAVIVQNGNSEHIGIGSTITLSDGKKEIVYKIVGDLEANPSEGKISLLSPIGKALAGKKLGEQIQIQTPSKTITYKILNVMFG